MGNYRELCWIKVLILLAWWLRVIIISNVVWIWVYFPYINHQKEKKVSTLLDEGSHGAGDWVQRKRKDGWLCAKTILAWHIPNLHHNWIGFYFHGCLQIDCQPPNLLVCLYPQCPLSVHPWPSLLTHFIFSELLIHWFSVC